MSTIVIPVPPTVLLPVEGTDETFPVRRDNDNDRGGYNKKKRRH